MKFVNEITLAPRLRREKPARCSAPLSSCHYTPYFIMSFATDVTLRCAVPKHYRPRLPFTTVPRKTCTPHIHVFASDTHVHAVEPFRVYFHEFYEYLNEPRDFPVRSVEDWHAIVHEFPRDCPLAIHRNMYIEIWSRGFAMKSYFDSRREYSRRLSKESAV